MVLLNLFARWVKNRDANVAMIFALAAVPITFLTGMGVDYTLAIDRQVQLNGASDAAVLAAITPTMMTQTSDVAIQAAKDTFNAQASTIVGATYQPSAVNVTVTTSGAKRVVTLAYTAQSNNTFASLLQMNTIAISGGAQGTGGQAPNINFYLLLDDSPSMAIGATQNDINTLMANTPAQDSGAGCGFGCHETNPAGESPALGLAKGQDNYALARSLGLSLRMDLVSAASANLMDVANTAATKYQATYQMAIYTFDQAFNSISALTTPTAAKSSAAGIQFETVYVNNWLTKSNNNQDMDTDVDNGLTSLNGLMPNPGSGTGIQNDQPQEVVFLVTDGMQDKIVGGSRHQAVVNTANCTAIKQRGIRIAVLYTVFLPLPKDSYYNTSDTHTVQPNVGPALQSCASPGLYYAVETGGDISAALATLFQYAVQTAYLSQ